MEIRVLLTERLDGCAIITLKVRKSATTRLSFPFITEVVPRSAIEAESDQGGEPDRGPRPLLVPPRRYPRDGRAEQSRAGGARRNPRVAALSITSRRQSPRFGTSPIIQTADRAIQWAAYGGAALLSSCSTCGIAARIRISVFCGDTAGQFELVFARPGRDPECEGIALHGGWSRREAERIGLLNQIVPSGKVREAAVEMAHIESPKTTPHGAGHQAPLHRAWAGDWQALRPRGRGARDVSLRRPPARRLQDFLARQAGTA